MYEITKSWTVKEILSRKKKAEVLHSLTLKYTTKLYKSKYRDADIKNRYGGQQKRIMSPDTYSLSLAKFFHKDAKNTLKKEILLRNGSAEIEYSSIKQWNLKSVWSID